MKKVSSRVSVIAAVALLMGVGAAPAALIINSDSLIRPGWTVVTFTGTGSDEWLVPMGVTSMEVLVVGGGGGGGQNPGSGGGGGGFYESLSYTGFGASLSVTVGAGGAINGGVGGASILDGFTAYGGNTQYGVAAMGSSGGNNQDANSAIAVISGAWTGGSGAGQQGGSGFNAFGGNGLTSSITGSATYYGGGGGALFVGGSPPNGGLGGGGSGGDTSYPPTAGTNGLGGGGGEARDYGDQNGAVGGSGVVIVAYQAIPEPASFGMLGAAAAAMLLRRRLRG